MTEFTDEDKRLMLIRFVIRIFLILQQRCLHHICVLHCHIRTISVQSFTRNICLHRVLVMKSLWEAEARIVSLLSEKKVFTQDGTVTAKMVWEYVNHGLNTVPDYGTGNWPAEADGCIKCEIITEVSKRVVFVEICRAIGILARLNPVTGKAEGVCEKNGDDLL